MTKATEQERAEFQEWALSKWPLMDVRTRSQDGNYADFETRTRFMAWQEAAARRAPVVPQEGLHRIRILLRVAKNQVNKATMSHAISVVQDELEKVALAAAPQPPEADMGIPISVAAPVRLPEPVGCTTKPWGVAWNTSQIEAGTKLYTEQQVRELLAAHGIQ